MVDNERGLKINGNEAFSPSLLTEKNASEQVLLKGFFDYFSSIQNQIVRFIKVYFLPGA